MPYSTKLDFLSLTYILLEYERQHRVVHIYQGEEKQDVALLQLN